MPDDIASAARRVTEKLRFHVGEDMTGKCFVLDAPDLVALLPILDTLTARADGNRVERWAGAMCGAAGHTDPDQPYAGGKLWEKWAPMARFTIALAEAERVSDRDAIARRLLSLHGADLDDLAHARRNVDYLLDGEG